MKNNKKSGKDFNASRMSRLWYGGLLLVAGSVAFLTFWIPATESSINIIPWYVPIAVHGISIMLLSIGLILIAWNTDVPRTSYLITRLGAIVAITGLIILFPLIPIGLGIFATGLFLGGKNRKGAIVAIIGSALLFGAIALGARVGMEDAPELSIELQTAFQVGVLLIAIGFIVIGWGESRSISRRVK